MNVLILLRVCIHNLKTLVEKKCQLQFSDSNLDGTL